MTLNLKLSNIKVSDEIEAVYDPQNGELLYPAKPKSLLVSICARNDTEQGNLDVCFEVEIRDSQNMTFDEIESLAVSRASMLFAS